MADRNRNLTMEDCQIVLRNFSGAEGEYNRAGDRNFGVLLPTPMAEAMIKEGYWTGVKFFKVKEEGDEPQAWMKVRVKFPDLKKKPKARPLRIVLISSRGKTELTEETVGVLDWMTIKKVDLIIRPYEWDVKGDQGVSAYLQSIYVTILEDDLELKYADLPDSAMSSLNFIPDEPEED